jgi:hypothetical protein
MTEQQTTMQPQPVPLQFQTSVVPSSAGSMVVISVDSPMGRTFLFLDHATAETFGEQVRSAGKQARTGLVIAQSGLALVQSDGATP